MDCQAHATGLLRLVLRIEIFVDQIKKRYIGAFLLGGYITLIPFLAGVGWEAFELKHEISCPGHIHFSIGAYTGSCIGAPIFFAPMVAIAVAVLCMLPILFGVAFLYALDGYRKETSLIGRTLYIFLGIPLVFVFGLLGWIGIVNDLLRYPPHERLYNLLP